MDMPGRPLYSFAMDCPTTAMNTPAALCRKPHTADDTVTVYVDVTNAGPYDGMETVQLYVKDVISSVVTL